MERELAELEGEARDAVEEEGESGGDEREGLAESEVREREAGMEEGTKEKLVGVAESEDDDAEGEESDEDELEEDGGDEAGDWMRRERERGWRSRERMEETWSWRRMGFPRKVVMRNMRERERKRWALSL